MTRGDALRAFDLLKGNSYPAIISARHDPRHNPDEMWSVTLGNLDHVQLKGLVWLLDDHGFAARASMTSGLIVEDANEQRVRRIVG